MKRSTRTLSAALAKPHHAGAAYMRRIRVVDLATSRRAFGGRPWDLSIVSGGRIYSETDPPGRICIEIESPGRVLGGNSVTGHRPDQSEYAISKRGTHYMGGIGYFVTPAFLSVEED